MVNFALWISRPLAGSVSLTTNLCWKSTWFDVATYSVDLYRADLPIHATPADFALAASRIETKRNAVWRDWTNEARADFLRWTDPNPIRIPGGLQMGEVMSHLRRVLPADTIMCNGAGNFAIWVHRFWPFRHYGTRLAPTSGSMGYGLPAGVGAKRLWPERSVVVFAA